MSTVAQVLRGIFGRGGPRVHIQAEEAVKVAALIRATCDEECTCDDVYRVLDEFVERSARGEDTSALMPFLKTHLETCCDCREEAEALLRALGAAAA